MSRHVTKRLEPGSQYQFRVDSENECGIEQSLVKSITLSSVPSKMPLLETRREGCSVLVRWNEPETGGLPILYYRIEIQTAKSTWFDLKDLCLSTDTTSCSIPMYRLAGSGINLQPGDAIVVRGSALNARGSGIPSLPNVKGSSEISPAIMIAEILARKPKLKLQIMTQKQISLKWDTLFSGLDQSSSEKE